MKASFPVYFNIEYKNNAFIFSFFDYKRNCERIWEFNIKKEGWNDCVAMNITSYQAR